jgi:hypothetical protein
MWIFVIKIPYKGKETVHVVAREDQRQTAWDKAKWYTGGKQMISARWFDIRPEDLANGGY